MLKHGLTDVVDTANPRTRQRRAYRAQEIGTRVRRHRKPKPKSIDRRYKAGREASVWLDSLIADQGGVENISTLKMAVIQVIASKYYRLLRAYQFVYQQPPPPIIDDDKRVIHRIYEQIDTLEDSFIKGVKELGLEAAIKSVPDLAKLLAEKRAEQQKDGAKIW